MASGPSRPWTLVKATPNKTSGVVSDGSSVGCFGVWIADDQEQPGHPLLHRFSTLSAAMAHHDLMMRGLEHCWSPTNFFAAGNPGARFVAELTAFKTLLHAEGKRADQIYVPNAISGGLMPHPESMVHLNLRSLTQDLGESCTGQDTYALLSSDFAVFGTAGVGDEARPTVKRVVGDMRSGRVSTCVASIPEPDIEAFCRELHLRVPGDGGPGSVPSSGKVRSYKCIFPLKGYSPCIADGWATLALCGSRVRKYAEEGDIVLIWGPHGVLAKALRVTHRVTQLLYMTTLFSALLALLAHAAAEPAARRRPRPWAATPSADSLDTLQSTELRPLATAAKRARLLPPDFELYRRTPTPANPRHRTNLPARTLRFALRSALNLYKARRAEFVDAPAEVDPETFGGPAKVDHEAVDAPTEVDQEASDAPAAVDREAFDAPAEVVHETAPRLEVIQPRSLVAAAAESPARVTRPVEPPAPPLLVGTQASLNQSAPTDPRFKGVLEKVEQMTRRLVRVIGGAAAHAVAAQCYRVATFLQPAGLLFDASERAGAETHVVLVLLSADLVNVRIPNRARHGRACPAVLEIVERGSRFGLILEREIVAEYD